MLRQSCLPNGGKDRYIINTTDRIFTRNTQTYGIIFSITGIGEFDLAKDGSVEGPWAPNPLIRKALLGPSSTVHSLWSIDTGSYLVHLKIRH